jgi:hypothetical protein
MNNEKMLRIAIDILADYATTPLWELGDVEITERIGDLLREAGYDCKPEVAVRAYGWGVSLGEFVRAVVKETHEK